MKIIKVNAVTSNCSVLIYHNSAVKIFFSRCSVRFAFHASEHPLFGPEIESEDFRWILEEQRQEQ